MYEDWFENVCKMVDNVKNSRLEGIVVRSIYYENGLYKGTFANI